MGKNSNSIPLPLYILAIFFINNDLLMNTVYAILTNICQVLLDAFKVTLLPGTIGF